MLGYDRSVHLLDIENLLSTGEIEPNAINAVYAVYKQQVTVGKDDLVIVGVSSVAGLVALAASDLRNCRLLYQPGQNGADLALQEVLNHEHLERRFEVAHVATGDGGFSPSVAALAGRGAYVVVISLSASLSRRLRLAAHQTIELRTEAIEQDAA